MRDANIHHRPYPSIADRSRASPAPSSSSSSSPTARTKTLFHHRASALPRDAAPRPTPRHRARGRASAPSRAIDRALRRERTMMTRALARRQKTDARASRAAGVASRERESSSHTRTARRPFGHSDARPTARAFFPTPPRAFSRGRRGGGLCAGTYIRIITIIKRYKKHLAQTRDGARCRVSNFASPPSRESSGALIFDVHRIKNRVQYAI